MTQPPVRNVLSVPRTDEPDTMQAEAGGATSEEAAARVLLAIRSLPDAEAHVLELVRDTAGSAWVALYRSAEGRYRLRRTLQIDAARLPDSLDPSITEDVVQGPEIRALDDDAGLAGRFPGVVAYARMQAEFDHLPALLFFGKGESGEELHLDDLPGVVDVCGIALRNAELVERLRSEVFIDFLTNCYNRRAFEEHLAVEMVRARRYDRALCLLLLDLDEFKSVNDSGGHPHGDHVLQKVAEALRAAFRTTDRVCRFGGDEFAVIFPETTKADVLRLAERMRRQISTMFPDDGVGSAVTASIGIACYPGDAARAEDLVQAADHALYRAKNGGRNQVACY